MTLIHDDGGPDGFTLDELRAVPSSVFDTREKVDERRNAVVIAIGFLKKNYPDKPDQIQRYEQELEALQVRDAELEKQGLQLSIGERARAVYYH